MIPILALGVAMVALVAFAMMLRKGVRRGSGGRHRRYFAIDLEQKHAPEPVRDPAEL